MLNKSEEIKNISQALLDFHKEVAKIGKDSTNPFFKSKYAGLPTILEAIKEPLQKAKLVFLQFPVRENELSTIVIHVPSGEFFEGTYKMTPAKNDPQGQGSVITYQRRYALAAILGLNIDEDDDGNAASFVSQSQKSAKLPPKSTQPMVCSIHANVQLIKKTTPDGKKYYACPVAGCKTYRV